MRFVATRIFYLLTSHCFKSMKDEMGDKKEVRRLSRHLLNRASSNRTISKQECMVLLRNLKLVHCTETIETVSISGQYRVQDSAQSTILQKYRKRKSDLHHLSLDQFFYHLKNQLKSSNRTYIPHYVGGSSNPVYPVTKGYAKASLIIYKPWNPENPPFDDYDDVVSLFNDYLSDPRCPVSLKIQHERMRWRYLEKLVGCEPTSESMHESGTTDVDQDTKDVLDISGTFNTLDDPDKLFGYNFETGLNYNWSEAAMEVSQL